MRGSLEVFVLKKIKRLGNTGKLPFTLGRVVTCFINWWWGENMKSVGGGLKCNGPKLS